MNVRNVRQLKVLIFTLIAIVTLGIGYAGITAINLVINGDATASVNDQNFKVKFLSEENVTPTITGEGNTVSVKDDTTAEFSVSSLTGLGDSEVATFRVKNTKTVTINGTDYTVRIANKSTAQNCGNSDYSQTACGFVVEFADIVEQRSMNSTNTNVGGWPGSELYTYLQGTFYNSLPNELKSAIKPTRVISGHGYKDADNFISTDNLYLLSGVEVFGSDDYDTAAGTTHQLEYYVGKSKSDRIKQYNGSDCYYLLRPASALYFDTFRIVGNNGGSTSIYAVDSSSGVAPAFRIG